MWYQFEGCNPVDIVIRFEIFYFNFLLKLSTLISGKVKEVGRNQDGIFYLGTRLKCVPIDVGIYFGESIFPGTPK